MYQPCKKILNIFKYISTNCLRGFSSSAQLTIQASNSKAQLTNCKIMINWLIIILDQNTKPVPQLSKLPGHAQNFYRLFMLSQNLKISLFFLGAFKSLKGVSKSLIAPGCV